MLRVDQGLTNLFINSNFGIGIAHENAKYTPALGTPYAEIYTIPNDQAALSTDTDQTDGIFRIILRYPLQSGAITAKTMADTIFAVFKVGSYTYYPDTTGQKIEITGLSRDTGYHEVGWYKLVLSIRYNAFIRR
jgi:hypothetical protein